jgi:hypothetical protein
VQNKRTRHRYQPAKNPPAIHLTERDRQVLVALYNFRVLTTPQIQKLYFPSKKGSKDDTRFISCRRRLHKLYHNKFVERLRVPVLSGTGTRPLVHALKQLGAEVVAKSLDVGEINWKARDNKISPIVLDHLLEINDVRVAVELATRDSPFVLNEWLDERELKRCQKGLRKPLVTFKKTPDGYFVIHNTKKKTKACFFLEVDRGTESGRSKVAGKIKAYQNYYFGGQYTKDFGTKSLRVLFVVNSRKRLENLLKNVVARISKGNIFWFSVMGEVAEKNILTDLVWQTTPKGQQALFNL